jgi:hypothetical protein
MALEEKRSTKELLEIVKKYVEKKVRKEHCGICFCINNLHFIRKITSEERDKLLAILRKKSVKYNPNAELYWWPRGEVSPRIEFLDTLIEEEEKKISWWQLFVNFFKKQP